MNKKLSSFTLIELIISVTIFIFVVMVAVTTISIAIGTKSKIQGINSIKTNGASVLTELENIISLANYEDTSVGYYGFAIRDSSGAKVGTADTDADCMIGVTGTSLSANLASQIIASYKDANNQRTDNIIKFDVSTSKIILEKIMYNSTGAEIARSSKDMLNKDIFLVNRGDTLPFINSFRYANNKNCGLSTFVNVNYALQARETGYFGPSTQMIYSSIFTPKYPYPVQPSYLY